MDNFCGGKEGPAASSFWRTPWAADAGAGDRVGACTPFLDYDALQLHRAVRKRVPAKWPSGALLSGHGCRWLLHKAYCTHALVVLVAAETVLDTSLFCALFEVFQEGVLRLRPRLR